jgi:hypothetical protein
MEHAVPFAAIKTNKTPKIFPGITGTEWGIRE